MKVIDRRDFVRLGLAGGMGAALGVRSPAAVRDGGEKPTSGNTAETGVALPSFELEEATIAGLQVGMASGKYTSVSLTEAYLARIEAVDRRGPAVNSVIELNPDARDIARELDERRREKGPLGPLHGIPVLIKDNIDTADRMATTAGSLALAGAPAPGRDAEVARRLRQAGAVILGKTNLSEWANFRSSRSSSGWSGRGGQTRNPYALDRNPCGSSSGSGAAVSASLAAVAVGTETDGSIVCPSSANGVVGIKPTLGMVSRAGIVPIAHSQDTAGPMARTVADAAVLLSVLAGADPRDPATAAGKEYHGQDFTRFLDPAGMKGARIGIVRDLAGFDERVDALFAGCVTVFKDLGAEVVDPVSIPTLGRFDNEELEVLLYEFKADLNTYLAGRGAGDFPRTLRDLIAWNTRNREREMPWCGQDLFEKAEAKGPLSDKPYREALKKCRRLSREKGIDAVMDRGRLDALAAPTGGIPWLTDWVNGDHFRGGCSTFPAVSGYPHITVPAGFIFGLPVGVSFFGRAFSEPVLIRLAYAFEQASTARRAPRFLQSADLKS